ncbi:hypothetical protein CHUAL_009163 [Chamberlinius hualienensis]
MVDLRTVFSAGDPFIVPVPLPQTFSCVQHKVRFTNYNNLLKHCRKHHGRGKVAPSFECTLCHHQLWTIKTMKNHILRTHPPGYMDGPGYFEMAVDDLKLEGQLTPDLDPHPCPHCNRLFSKKGLPHHIHHQHPGTCLANPPSPIGPLQPRIMVSPVSSGTLEVQTTEPPTSPQPSCSGPIADSSLGISWSPGKCRTTFSTVSSVSSPGLPLIWMPLSATVHPPQTPVDLEPIW